MKAWLNNTLKENLHIEPRTILSLGRGIGGWEANVVKPGPIKDGGHDAVTTGIYLARLVNKFVASAQHSNNSKTSSNNNTDDDDNNNKIKWH